MQVVGKYKGEPVAFLFFIGDRVIASRRWDGAGITRIHGEIVGMTVRPGARPDTARIWYTVEPDGSSKYITAHETELTPE